jgi:hypothetical protein
MAYIIIIIITPVIIEACDKIKIYLCLCHSAIQKQPL